MLIVIFCNCIVEIVYNYVECFFGKYGLDCRENCSGYCWGNMICDLFFGFCREDCELVERKYCVLCKLIRFIFEYFKFIL